MVQPEDAWLGLGLGLGIGLGLGLGLGIGLGLGLVRSLQVQAWCQWRDILSPTPLQAYYFSIARCVCHGAIG